jgi:trehalose 6-phosphate phosphatase
MSSALTPQARHSCDRAGFAEHRQALYLAAVTENRLPEWPPCPALFLDLDGTLLEFADQPDAVEPSDRLKNLLGRLAEFSDGAVAFVSGRTIEDLDRLLAPHRFALAGVHGNERRDVDGNRLPSGVDRRALDVLRARLERFRDEHSGTIVEDKGISLALHFRQRPDLGAEIDEYCAELDDDMPTGFELLRGNKVVEIKPTGQNKGTAIGRFMTEPPFAGKTPIFIGDDVTDEAGFEVVNRLGGMSIKVDNGDTVARWHLPDIDAVLEWLEEALV